MEQAERSLMGGFEGLPPAAPDLPPPVTSSQVSLFRRILEEQKYRKGEPTRLYEPLGQQLAFHQSQARERLVRGSNRGGKTITGAVETGWALTGRHPYRQYPTKGRAYIVGYDLAHVGGVMWDKLSAPQMKFRRIRDLETKQWRAYQPWRDADREGEAEPMPPILPPRLIKNVAWNSLAKNIPEKVVLHNGWELQFFSGNSTPPRGADVDLVWFDEEIPNGQWYFEMAARLLDRSGCFFWTATPQTGGQQMLNLHVRCEEQALLPKDERQCEEFHLLLSQNPYIDQKEKDLLAAKYAHDPEEYAVRIEGEYKILGELVYPTWSHKQHGHAAFEVPADWCRYAVIDPGYATCAVLFLAVPPPRHVEAGRIYAYRELYIRNCDAAMFADKMKTVTEGEAIQAYIMDMQGGRRTDGATGQSLAQAYSEALKKRGVRSIGTGHGFLTADCDIDAGMDAVRQWLSYTLGDGRPKFQYFTGACYNLDAEMRRFVRVRKDGVLIDRTRRVNDHLCDCMRYAALHKLRYVKPQPLKPKNNRYSKPTDPFGSKPAAPKGIYLTAGKAR